mgnify:CR=1 FL=1
MLHITTFIFENRRILEYNGFEFNISVLGCDFLAKKKRSKHTVKNNLYMLGLVWKISPSRVLLTFMDALLGFGFWVFETVIFMRYLFGAADINRTFPEVALFLGLTVSAWMLQSVFDSWFRQRFCLINNQHLYKELNRILFNKACNVDISCYENAEFYNSYTKAAGEVYTRSISVVEELSRMVSACLSSAYVIYVMFTINVWAGLIAMLPVISNLTLGRLAGRLDYEKNMDTVPYARRQDYVNRVFYLQKYSKEIRLTGVLGILLKSYNDAMNGIIRVSKKYWKRLMAANAVKTTVCFPLFFEGTWLLGSYFAMVKNVISVSDFVVLANAAVSTTWMLINFTNSLNSTFANALYIDNLKMFLEYKEKIPENQPGLPAPKEVDCLELKNVCFRYGDDQDFVLKNINIKLEKGKLISLVGHNGSGKSTLIKLLMRLYDPSVGEILLNGVNIKKYNVHEYRVLIGSTFQDFQIFSMSVSDNVIMCNSVDGDPHKTAVDALDKSGVLDKIESLPMGMDSILTREFDDDGINLSGGEIQKVTVARSFAKKCSILLLDEPSSALDPIAEYKLYANFVQLCRGKYGQKKISVFISHRLSSAVVADYIYLLENGEITESGTHGYLMRQNGAYANMFIKQSENYLMEIESV